MSFPSGTQIETENLSSGTSSPAEARLDLLSLVTSVNDLIASENDPNGVCVLDSGGRVLVSQLPTNMNPATLSLAPASGFVQIVDCIRLPAKAVADLAIDFVSPQRGDIVSLSNGDGGDPCLAMYNGSAWKVIALGSTVSAT